MSHVINVLDAHNGIVPPGLGTYPNGALIIQFVDCDGKVDSPLLHNTSFAYWNLKEWSVIDVGGVCSAHGRMARWIVIADGRRIIQDQGARHVHKII